MNFHKARLRLKKLLIYDQRIRQGKQKGKKVITSWPGCYIFSQEEPTKAKVFKIGMSSHIYERLKNYKLCFPFNDEFNIPLLVLTKNGEDAFEIEQKIIKALKAKGDDLERKNLTSKEYKAVANLSTLKNKVKKVLNDNLEIWQWCLIFTKPQPGYELSFKAIENKGKKLGFSAMNNPSSRRAWVGGALIIRSLVNAFGEIKKI